MLRPPPRRARPASSLRPRWGAAQTAGYRASAAPTAPATSQWTRPQRPVGRLLSPRRQTPQWVVSRRSLGRLLAVVTSLPTPPGPRAPPDPACNHWVASGPRDTRLTRDERPGSAGGQARVRVRRLGRRGQDDHLGGDRPGHGRPRRQGRGGDDRSRAAAGQRARPPGAGERAPAGRARAPRRRPGVRGRAVGDDARPQAHLRRADRPGRGRPPARPGSRTTASIASCPRRYRAPRSSPRWPSSTSSTATASSTCSCSTPRPRATRWTSSTPRDG